MVFVAAKIELALSFRKQRRRPSETGLLKAIHRLQQVLGSCELTYGVVETGSYLPDSML